MRKGISTANRISVILLILFGVFLFHGPVTATQQMDFAVIQPGQPGTPQDAQPVMDVLAAYIQKRLGPEYTVKGQYFNELNQALGFLKGTRPSWGIVSLGFFIENNLRLPMTPLARTLPGGSDKEIWRLAVGKNASDNWQALTGKIRGTMLFERDAAACLFFEDSPDKLPFIISGTYHPLRSLRATAKGKVAGIVLDSRQYEAMKNLPLVSKIKIIHISKELPTSPVIWFGPSDRASERLAGILRGMRQDPDAAGLLQLLQTTGFGPGDMELSRMRLNADEVCPR